jgi:hypothetical protein
MLQSNDFGVLTLNESNKVVQTDNFYVGESFEQKLCIELDFGIKNRTTESKNNETATSAPHHILVAPVHYEAG